MYLNFFFFKFYSCLYFCNEAVNYPEADEIKSE